jgi:hypothetical protein
MTLGHLIRADKKPLEDQMKEAGKPGDRFLLGTGVLPYDIPEENIRAMLGACQRDAPSAVPGAYLAAATAARAAC